MVDSAPDIGAALNVAMAAAGLPGVNESLTRHWIGHGSRVLLEQALSHHGRAELLRDEATVSKLLAVFIDHYKAHIADVGQPYAGVVETLTTLQRRGVGLAVVTNKLTGLSQQVLQALDLRAYFDIVVCGDTLAVSKPNAAPALHACAALGVAPADALFVGDSITDVDTARNAGCPVVCVRDGYNHGTPADALGADGVIDSFTELL
ncbi:MAG: phosphoglycolate phosphatase [Gammaproteobacteria bacterium]|nr:phosphoglycolate phosphatase [Gammaproteobacteria bacterium]